MKSQKSFQKWNHNEVQHEALEEGNIQGNFDQFEENKKRNFTVEEFDEADYTTKLELEKVSLALLKEAEQMEKEILESKNDFLHTRHVLEERNKIEL